MVTMNLATVSGFVFHELKQRHPELLVSATSLGNESHSSVRTSFLHLLCITAPYHILCNTNIFEVVF